MGSVEYRVSPDLDGHELSELHQSAFDPASTAVIPWSDRLKRHSIVWATTEIGPTLVGFVNVIGDGGAHAFVLDTAVRPEFQGRGIGSTLIDIAISEARAQGCHWLHVDFEPELADFYLTRAGFQLTQAGLLRLR